jgi:hypothetical protein
VPTVKHLWGQISRSSKDFTKQKTDPVISSL